MMLSAEARKQELLAIIQPALNEAQRIGGTIMRSHIVAVILAEAKRHEREGEADVAFAMLVLAQRIVTVHDSHNNDVRS